ncbi:MAG: DUF3710 domain-containing protein [Actinomycetota bacterium]|nr:DUF3710 domain-containing protein [Actinomycetota bacterium]
MIFRRRSKPTDRQDGSEDVEAAEEHSGRSRGPWDRSETRADEGDSNYVDLGGLVVRGREGLELRLQVDEQTQTVASVLLAGPQSGLELRAFAAPRHDGLWDDVRADIVAEATKRGGRATEVDGEWGTELKLVVPVQTPDGRKASQASRVVGIDGPRWLLRGTFLGRSAAEQDPDGELEAAFRDVIVVRGEGPMAPRAMLALTMPSSVEIVSHDEEAAND